MDSTPFVVPESNHFYITVARSAFPCSALKEDELMGGRYDDHDWQKISNIDVGRVTAVFSIHVFVLLLLKRLKC
jgi:hypothetical protein